MIPPLPFLDSWSQAGAVRPLVLLCIGPEGPLPDLEAKAVAAAAAGGDTDGAGTDGDKKKGKKKKAKGKKKAKLEPGEAKVASVAG